MPDPLRRRVRARALAGLSSATAYVPAPLLRGALAGLAGAARFTRFERLARANLALALGSETSSRERERIAAGVRRHAARLLFEWARLARGARSPAAREALGEWLDSTVEIDPSIARLEAVAARGRGVLVATGHIGNWELLAAALRRRGLEGSVVGARKHRDPSADWLVEMRRAYGVETLPQHSRPRELLEVLRSGRVLGLLCDLEVRRVAGELLPFFGVPALTMTAPAGLARAAGLPLVPARCVLRGERYRVLVDEPLAFDAAPEAELDKRAATRALMTRMNAVLEGWIREDPEQWAWHQPRWRTRDPERSAIPLMARGLAGGEASRTGTRAGAPTR